jgi:hypothetical protein
MSKLIDDFEEAVRAHEMMGAMLPEHHATVEIRYRWTKHLLRRALEPRFGDHVSGGSEEAVVSTEEIKDALGIKS